MTGEVAYITREIEFDAGHRVPNHKSKCRNPHGHRYTVQVTITGPIIITPGASDEGMVFDFGDLKDEMTTRIHDVLDHGFIVYENDIPMLHAMNSGESWKVIRFPYIPTAENIARWCYETMCKGFTVWEVTVWETAKSKAVYKG